jgi:hypothetical protein
MSENSPPDFSVCVWVWAHLPISVCEWVRTHLLIWVCVWVRENSPPHLCLWVRERTHLPSALLSNHSSDNLLANRILDGRTDGQTDEHTRFSAETLNPDTPKRIPITLSDTLTLSDTHYIEWYPLRTHPRRYPLHWVIPIPWVIFPLTDNSHNPPKSLPITLRDPVFLTNKPDIEWYPWHWGIPLALSDTHYPEFF